MLKSLSERRGVTTSAEALGGRAEVTELGLGFVPLYVVPHLSNDDLLGFLSLFKMLKFFQTENFRRYRGCVYKM